MVQRSNDICGNVCGSANSQHILSVKVAEGTMDRFSKRSQSSKEPNLHIQYLGQPSDSE